MNKLAYKFMFSLMTMLIPTIAWSQPKQPALKDELQELLKQGADAKFDPCEKIDITPESERIDLWARKSGSHRAALQSFVDKMVPAKAPENRRLLLTFALLCQGNGYKILRELLICHFAIASTKELKDQQEALPAEDQ